MLGYVSARIQINCLHLFFSNRKYVQMWMLCDEEFGTAAEQFALTDKLVK